MIGKTLLRLLSRVTIIPSVEILTSSGFPKAAAVIEHSFFKKSSENLLAGKLLSKSMKGMFLVGIQMSV